MIIYSFYPLRFYLLLSNFEVGKEISTEKRNKNCIYKGFGREKVLYSQKNSAHETQVGQTQFLLYIAESEIATFYKKLQFEIEILL